MNTATVAGATFDRNRDQDRALMRRTSILMLGAFLAVASCLYASRLFALDNDADDYSAGAVPAGTNLALV
jgi:hypothetical protein